MLKSLAAAQRGGGQCSTEQMLQLLLLYKLQSSGDEPTENCKAKCEARCVLHCWGHCWQLMFGSCCLLSNTLAGCPAVLLCYTVASCAPTPAGSAPCCVAAHSASASHLLWCCGYGCRSRSSQCSGGSAAESDARVTLSTSDSPLWAISTGRLQLRW
jgi:hypothetical protein